MTKQEYQVKLDEIGIAYDKRWGEPRLKAIYEDNVRPQYSEEAIKNIEAKVSGQHDKPIENVLKITSRPDGEAVTKSGIVIPQEVLAKIPPTKWTYRAECSGDVCLIKRMMYNGREEEVRTYSQALQGNGFEELAEQFVKKNNR